MYSRIINKLNIRHKFIVIYVHMTLWTLPYIIGTVIVINKMGSSEVWQPDNVLKFYIPVTIIYSLIYICFTWVMGRALTKNIVFPLREAVENVEKIGKGDFRVEFQHDGNDEVAIMIKSLREMAESLKKETKILKRIADGDYTENINPRGPHDVIYKSFQEIQAKNNQFISEIRDASIQISTGAEQIASGAQNLANGSNEQSATIEQFGTSISIVKTKADENVETAQGTIEDIDKNTKLMQDNIEEIKKVNDFIDELAKDSQQIAKVIKVIDDIAFQTNILALNAAVEAARAGQHGKGFAVVADEVKDLASKSAQAAKETSALIKKSLDNVNEGSKLVEKTNVGVEQMGEIAIKNQSDMKKLSEASIDQGVSISEIDQGIAQISNVVQANSSMAEESAAAAQEMSAQAEHLNAMIDKFNVREEDIRPNINFSENISPVLAPPEPAGSVYEAPVETASEVPVYTAPVYVSPLYTDSAGSIMQQPDQAKHPETPQKKHGVEFVDAAGPELEDYSKIVVPNKYEDE